MSQRTFFNINWRSLNSTTTKHNVFQVNSKKLSVKLIKIDKTDKKIDKIDKN